MPTLKSSNNACKLCSGAQNAIIALDGRFFGGRTVTATLQQRMP